ncbi:MAG: DinB family protein [Thermoflexaceae bacterium]|nr:DinB family protein [Thermoflexaceae bacterium]
MAIAAALAKNLAFWHWYPELLTKGLSPEQLRWQPDGHDSSIVFATWHTYRAADELVHGMVFQRPSVFATGGWDSRLPVADTGASRFGNGMTRAQIAALDLDMGELCAYAKAVGEGISNGLAGMTDEEASAELALPFFAEVYPGYDSMTKLDAVAFFAIGHTAEHLGEVQMLKGLMGLKGAPL